MDSDVMKAARDLREALDAMRVRVDGSHGVGYDDVPGGPARAFRAALDLLAGIEAASEQPKPPLWSDTRKTHALIYMTGFINDLLAQRASGAGQMTISGVRGAELIRHLQELCRRDIEAASAEPQPSAAIATEADVPDEIQWAIDALCEAAYAWADSDSEPDSPEAQAERDAEKALKLAIMKPMRHLAAERDSAQERVDLDVDEFQRIKAELDNLRIGLAPQDCDSARVLYDLVSGICDRAVAAGRQRVPLIQQRDKASAERDALRAKIKTLVEACDAFRAFVANERDNGVGEIESRNAMFAALRAAKETE